MNYQKIHCIVTLHSVGHLVVNGGDNTALAEIEANADKKNKIQLTADPQLLKTAPDATPKYPKLNAHDGQRYTCIWS